MNVPTLKPDPLLQAGIWLTDKYRNIAEQKGVRHACSLMKKQGIDLRLARLILFGK